MRILDIVLMGLMLICGSCAKVPSDASTETRPAPTTGPQIEPTTIPAPAPTTQTAPGPTTKPAPMPATKPAPADRKPPTAPHRAAVELDLTKIDANGLRGPEGGKVLVSYEFAIPDTAECRAQVKAIDKSVRFMRGSRGRIKAGKGECLCIGETGPNWRTVLDNLAKLPYVKRIIECHWE